MFKTTQDNLDHIKRVASASTREHANGRIDMIPPWAQPVEKNSLKETLDISIPQAKEIKIQINALNLILDSLSVIDGSHQRIVPKNNIETFLQIKRQRDELKNKIRMVRQTAKEHNIPKEIMRDELMRGLPGLPGKPRLRGRGRRHGRR